VRQYILALGLMDGIFIKDNEAYIIIFGQYFLFHYFQHTSVWNLQMVFNF
jgi:hypothetical protein